MILASENVICHLWGQRAFGAFHVVSIRRFIAMHAPSSADLAPCKLGAAGRLFVPYLYFPPCPLVAKQTPQGTN